MANIDLRDKTTVKDISWERSKEVHDHSELWATIAKPFAWFVFSLVTLIVLFPFLLITINILVTKNDRFDLIMQWSTTVLAPIVGFGSAVVGYYFGANGSLRAESKSEKKN